MVSPLVSVCVITYQHNKFIRQCLDSIVNQSVDFPFEVVIGDDGSTDGTASICHEYQQKYPHLIKLTVHDRTKNRDGYKGSPGKYNLMHTLAQTKGKYIAFCEGDDYWLDNTKLQQQVDFLEQHPDFTLSFHSVAVNVDNKLEKDSITSVTKSESTLIDLAAGNYIHTPSVVYRNVFPERFPDFFYNAPVSDYLLHIYAAERGRIKYFDKEMAAYRLHGESYWSSKTSEDRMLLWLDVLSPLVEYFRENVEVSSILRDQLFDLGLALINGYSLSGNKPDELKKVVATLTRADASRLVGCIKNNGCTNPKTPFDAIVMAKKNTGDSLPQLAKKLVKERQDEFQSSAQRHRFYVQIAEHLVEQSRSKADYPLGKGIPTVVKDELREVSVLLAEELDIGQVEPNAQRLTDNITQIIENDSYQLWVHQHSMREVDAEIIAERMTLEWKYHPTLHCFLFLLPGEENLLADTIDSLGAQFYPKWRLTVIAGTPVPDPIFDQVDNLRWRMMLEGESPYEVLNQQVSDYGTEWTLFIEPGTRFEVNTFAKITDYINLHPEWSFIYTDDDQVDAEGRRTSPRFKPDFNFDLLRSSPYIGVGWMRTQDLLAMGGISQLPGAENYELALRWLDSHDETVMGHIADVLIHLPKQGDRPFDSNAGRLALEQHLERNAIESTVHQGYVDNSYRVEYHHPDQPKVTIIIPTKDKLEFFQPCIESLLEKTSYPNYEVIVVDNQSTDPDTLAYYRVLAENYPDKVQVCFYDKPFNFSAMNNWAAEKASGDYLLLLNNDTEIIQAEWLSRMMAYGQRDDIGIVGARLVYPTTGKVQHVGVVLGLTLIADHPYNGQLGLKDDSHMGRAQLDQNYSAVTAAVLLVKKDVYREVGGMDAENLAVLFNDVDLCIKVGDAGYKILWTPHAVAVHHGSTSVGNKPKFGIYTDFQAFADKQIRTQKEQRFMLTRWLPLLGNDPAYNKNLSLCQRDSRVDINFMHNWDVNYHSRLRCFGVPISGGSGFYRLAQPFNMLSEQGLAQCEVGRHHVSVTELERLKPDTYVFQNTINDQEIANIRFIGEVHPSLHKVFTIDDLLHDLPEKSSLYRNNKRKFRDAKARIRQALSYCDRLIASTQPLADLCADMIDDIRVIPNRLEGKVWSQLASKKQQGDKPRVGWAGALQHQGDLEIIVDVVKETASEVDWIFMGMCPDEIKDYIKEFHPPVPIESYPEKLASLNLDLAIAPLEIHPFNESKTNLRLLEYGILGWPVICTDIYPYRSHNAPVIKVRNEKHEWLNAIRAAVSSPEMLHEAGETIRQWVLDNFILEDHLHEWMDALTPTSIQALKQAAVKAIEEAADVA